MSVKFQLKIPHR